MGNDPPRQRAERYAAGGSLRPRKQKFARLKSDDGDAKQPAIGIGDQLDVSVRPSLRLGAICAAEIISHYGARPEVDLKALAETKLG